MWNCIAAYHPTALDSTAPLNAPTRPPSTVSSSALHTSANRALCSAHAINALLVGGLNIKAVEPFQHKMEESRLDKSIPSAVELASSANSQSEVGGVGRVLDGTRAECATGFVRHAPRAT